MDDPRVLLRVDGVLRPLLVAGPPDLVSAARRGWAESGLTVRTVRGRKMRTLTGLYDEFAAALQFPSYFGENRDAFTDCIAELEGLPPGEGYVIVVTEPEQVLDAEGPDALAWLARSLAAAAQDWAQPIDLGEWWDRPAVPFHLVLVGDVEVVTAASRHWTGAGLDPVPWPGSPA